MNLQGKLSGLKGLVTSHSKRRFKGDLSVDMISPPLGDFRHTMHVGRGGDVFGDTSFLSNHGGTANNGNNGDTDSTVSSPDNKLGAFFSRTLRHVRKSSDSRPREVSKELSPPPPPVSPIIKNAISLPRLDVDVPNGSPTAKVLFPSSLSTPEEKCSYGLESGFVTLPRLSRSERQQPSVSISPSIHRGSLTDATDAILSTVHSAPLASSNPEARTTAFSDSLSSLTSLDTFTFDLGPSLMSEVFGLLHSPGDVRPEGEEPGPTCWEAEEAGWACGLTSEGSEMDSATISYVDSLLREDCCGSGKGPYVGAQWEEEEAGSRMDVNGAGLHLKGVVPDVLMGSPGQDRLGMGLEMESEPVRHYGVSGLLKGQHRADVADAEAMTISQTMKKMSYSYVDDEEEIKV